MKVGLRIEVDTLSGTRDGVPTLLRTLDAHGIRGAFFFSVGPDNMGRNLWRLFKPAFLWKMLRTKAASLYGWDILFMGTAWPGPRIGKRCEGVIRDAAKAGHEIGVHAWDHRLWQAKSDRMTPEQGFEHVKRAFDELLRITGTPPTCSASPGWRCTERLIQCKEALPFRYNSDCRGRSPFYPVTAEGVRGQLQIPVTLPTYDEAVGRGGVTDANYNDHQISLLSGELPNVLTIHAEAEGGRCRGMFDEYLARVAALGYEVIPLGELAARVAEDAPEGRIELRAFPGREGVLAVQV